MSSPEGCNSTEHVHGRKQLTLKYLLNSQPQPSPPLFPVGRFSFLPISYIPLLSKMSLSHFVSADVLSSPISEAAPWSASQDGLFSAYSQSDYSLPASPLPTSVPDSPAMQLKSRLSPDSSSDSEQLCMPTHQLFDLPATPVTGRSPSPCMGGEQQSFSGGVKRQGSFTTAGTRKPRERMSTKDFIPPDVSGLSKREARLVKNRAAAFLSRQRKREEFETMEVYVFRLRLLHNYESNLHVPAELRSSNRRTLVSSPSPGERTRLHYPRLTNSRLVSLPQNNARSNSAPSWSRPNHTHPQSNSSPPSLRFLPLSPVLLPNTHPNPARVLV
jgi:hypothetical protein